jgi:hypothetical protein
VCAAPINGCTDCIFGRSSGRVEYVRLFGGGVRRGRNLNTKGRMNGVGLKGRGGRKGLGLEVMVAGDGWVGSGDDDDDDDDDDDAKQCLSCLPDPLPIRMPM